MSCWHFLLCPGPGSGTYNAARTPYSVCCVSPEFAGIGRLGANGSGRGMAKELAVATFSPPTVQKQRLLFKGSKRTIQAVGRPRCLRAGLFDVAKERARLARQREKLAKELAAVAARVSNAAFMARAPPHVVAEVRLGLPEDGRGFHSYVRLIIQRWREL